MSEDAINKRLDRLENIFDTVNKLTLQIEKLAVETKFMREDYNKINDRLSYLEKKPEKRYDTVVNCLITGVIGAIIGAIMSAIITLM